MSRKPAKILDPRNYDMDVLFTAPDGNRYKQPIVMTRAVEFQPRNGLIGVILEARICGGCRLIMRSQPRSKRNAAGNAGPYSARQRVNPASSARVPGGYGAK